MLIYFLMTLLFVTPALAQEPSAGDKLNSEVARMIGRLQIENTALKLAAEANAQKIRELLDTCGAPCNALKEP